MLRILYNTKIDFIRHWRTAVIITIAFVVVGFGSALVNGWFHYSIEFTGGTLMQLEFKEAPDVSRVRAAVERAGVGGAEITQYGSPTDFRIRAQSEETTDDSDATAVAHRISEALTAELGAGSFVIADRMAIGPRVGAELRTDAVIAVLISFVTTLLYLAWRFEWRFGVAAIFATFHDIIATIAFIKLLDLEISLTVIAAVLTVLGYSLNDTIIIFDRVRENLHKNRKQSLHDTLNLSVNETLPRTALTGGTAVGATLALLLLGGPVIRPFAWVMTFGIIVGTFSSIFVASPILLWVESKWPRQSEARPKATRA